MEPLEEVREATKRLVRSVDQMPDEHFAAPSLLPGWSRGHVVAHLALNAEGYADALSALAEGRLQPVYASEEARDADIDELAVIPPNELRNRLLGATTEFSDVAEGLPDAPADAEIERTPGGRKIPLGSVLSMREREVEIHHADLDVGYDRSDWPAGFVTRLLEAMAGIPRQDSFTITATDLGRTWKCGPDGTGPAVSGTAADLGWWLTGRPVDTLTCDGELPEVEAW